MLFFKIDYVERGTSIFDNFEEYKTVRSKYNYSDMLTVSKEFNMRKQRAKKKQDSDISIHLKRRKIIPVLPLKSPYKTI